MAVVVLLIGIMLGIAIPRVRDTISNDRLKKTARLMIGMSRELRSDAAREQIDYELCLDMDRRCFWKYSVDMTSEKREEIKKSAVRLPEGIRFKDVYIYGKGKKSRGEAVIRFFKKGYVQPSVIHLDHQGKTMTLVFDPFIPNVKTYDQYLDVWQKAQAEK
jgi:Tfp pilus assembly protein FimT